MEHFRRRMEAVGVSFALLILALGFNALLTSGPLRKLYIETVIFQYRDMAGELQGQLETELPAIDSLQALLAATQRRLSDQMPSAPAASVSAINTDDIIQCSTDVTQTGAYFQPITAHAGYQRRGDAWFVSPPLKGSQPSYRIVIAFGSNQIDLALKAALFQAMNIILIIVGSGLIAFIALVNGLAYGKALKPGLIQRIWQGALFFLIVAAQLIFFAWNWATFKSFYQSLNVSGQTAGLFSRFREIGLDAATVLIISIFFLAEMLHAVSMFMEQRLTKQTEPNQKLHYNAIRPVFFLLLFGLYLSISFVPLYMEQLYQPLWGLSKELTLSLPISASVFFTGIGFLAAGIWNDRRGWREPFFAGSLLAGTGLIYAWLAPNAFHFILSRTVSGLGYGLFFMASQAFIIASAGQNANAQGFAALFAALYAAIICGSSTGAILAEHFGYQPIFLIGAIIIFFAISGALIFMRRIFSQPKALIPDPAAPKVNAKTVFRFLGDRNVLAIILFSSVPASMAMIGFLEYFNPVYLNRLGVSQANIGRTFLIYCIFMIYSGPLLSKYIDVSDQKKLYMVAGGLFGSLSFMAFNVVEGIMAVLIAIFCLGFSHSFVFVSQTVYLLNMKIVQETGEGKAIAAFRLVNRFGQAAGPVLFGGLIAAVDLRQSIAWVGFAYLCLTLLLLCLIQTDKRLIAAKP